MFGKSNQDFHDLDKIQFKLVTLKTIASKKGEQKSMMRKTIVRTLTTSKVEGYRTIMKEGKPDFECLEAVSVVGKVNEKEALKALEEKHGKGNIMVSNVSFDSATYEITVDAFLANAKRVESAPETVEEN